MAYDSKSLVCITPRLGAAEGGTDAGKSAAVWLYRSADAVGDVDATDYFTNGKANGMQVNDVVIVIDDNTPTVDVCLVTAIDSDGNATVVNFT